MSLSNWEHPEDLNLAAARKRAADRRDANVVRRLHHHAFRCRSAQETRDFYEGVLGFPLIAVCLEPIDPLTNEAKPYAHLYFELADGSALAFFDYPAHFDAKGDFEEVDQFGHHIAMAVSGGEATLASFRQRLSAAGAEVLELDHGYCKSLYFYDPNGLRLELATDVPVTEVFFADKARTVDADMATWNTTRSAYFGSR